MRVAELRVGHTYETVSGLCWRLDHINGKRQAEITRLDRLGYRINVPVEDFAALVFRHAAPWRDNNANGTPKEQRR